MCNRIHKYTQKTTKIISQVKHLFIGNKRTTRINNTIGEYQCNPILSKNRNVSTVGVHTHIISYIVIESIFTRRYLYVL